MRSSPVDQDAREYRAEQAVRAGICLGAAAFVGGIGLLLVLAGLSEDDEGSLNAGALLTLVGLGFLAGGIRLLYLRRHRQTPEQQRRGHVRQQVVLGSLGLVMAVGATVGVVYFGSLIGDQPFDAGGFYPYLILAAMMYPVGLVVVVGTVRRAGHLRRLARQPVGQGARLALAPMDSGDPNEPTVAIDGPQGVVVVPLVPRQNLTELAGEDGLVEVLGDPVVGGTVLLRTRAGEPVWPSGPAKRA